MKMLLFLLMLAGVATRLNAQVPRAKPKTKAPANKIDTAKKQDNMPIVKPRGSSPMPVAIPRNNSRMPVINPDTINKKSAGKSKPMAKP